LSSISTSTRRATPIALCCSKVFTGGNTLNRHAVVIHGSTIHEIIPIEKLDTNIAKINIPDSLLSPGFIDLQVNGAAGYLFSTSPTEKTLKKICEVHRQFGTTNILPTLISSDTNRIRSGISTVEYFIRSGIGGVLGIHIEGPYINNQKRGMHRKVSAPTFNQESVALLSSLSYGTTLITLAPESIPANSISALVDRQNVVAIGHSEASYEESLAALNQGATGFTHLFNAMKPLHSRDPGCLGAGLYDENSWVSIIADGIHVHPANIRIALAVKPSGKIILVSDAIVTPYCSNKTISYGSHVIYVQDGRCILSDGTIAGSCITLLDAIKYLTNELNVSLAEALRMASTYPAHAIKRSNELGYIAPGYIANLSVLTSDLKVIETWVNGQRYQYPE